MAFLCLVSGLLISGCKDRKDDVCGIWNWGDLVIHFDGDQTWGATDKAHPNMERFAGTWTLSGDQVSMEYIGAAPANSGDAEFTLSQDGRHMNADTGSASSMTKH